MASRLRTIFSGWAKISKEVFLFNDSHDKGVVKLVVKITKQKPSGLVVSFKDSPLAQSSEVIV